MREENARRKLNKKLDSRVRDTEGSTGNAKSFHKASRTYSKALIDSAVEDMAVNTAEAVEPCIMCGRPCLSLCCSAACKREAVDIGVIKSQEFV